MQETANPRSDNILLEDNDRFNNKLQYRIDLHENFRRKANDQETEPRFRLFENANTQSDFNSLKQQKISQ